MLVLGIDPGSVKMGWGLVEYHSKRMKYISSGALVFDQQKVFLDRLSNIQEQFRDLLQSINPDIVAMESLIYVKSPTALIKLAQTRGMVLSILMDRFQGKIFEYSPNLVKASTTGHGHASKESIQKFLSLHLGIREFNHFDESDALAVSICHILNNPNNQKQIMTKTSSRSIASAVKHKIKELN